MAIDKTNITDMRSIAKRTAKDSIFRDLFEDPAYLFQLYQALHPEDKTTTANDIKLVSIQNILLNQMYNDLGFLVGRTQLTLLILIEVQSTWSVNILIRILFYLVLTLKEYVESRKANLYGSKKIDLPKPELYLIYTGDRNDRPDWLSLAKEFFPGSDPFLDLRVKVIYDGAHGDIINQYVTFTRVYDEQIKQYGRTRKAILETIRICKDKDVLKQYLETRQKEVVDIMMTLFSQEYALDRYVEEKQAEAEIRGERRGIEKGRIEGLAEGKMEGRLQGRAEGKMEGKMEAALNMREKGLSAQNISDFLNVDIDDVNKWFASDSPSASKIPQ